MRAVVQRVSSAAVAVADRDGPREVARIGRGLLVFVGVERGDGREDVEYISRKIGDVRIFDDPADQSRHVDLSVAEAAGAVLVVSEFTLLGDCRKGRRPAFDRSAPPELAEPLYEDVLQQLRGRGLTVTAGRFRTTMTVSLVNEGPVTVLLDSRKTF